MARRRFTPIYLFVTLLAQMAAGMLYAQVPDVEVAPPVVNPQDPRRLQGSYFRPNLSPEILNLAELKLKPEMVDSIVSCLGLLVRNFPPGKPFSLEWKSRMLGIALRLRPDDPACVVANGQFVRGIVPEPIAAATPKLESLATELLKLATAVLSVNQDKTSVSHVLGLHLLDLAARIDPSNSAVLEVFLQDAPPFLWDKISSNRPAKLLFSEEETPDLRRTEASMHALLYRNENNRGKLVLTALAAQATKAPPEARRKALQLVLPSDSDRSLELALPGIRTQLKSRTSQWPAGWKIELKELRVQPPNQPGVLLNVALLLDSMINGTELDPKATLACGIDAFNGQTVRTMGLESFLAVAKDLPDGSLIIISEPNLNEVYDFIISQPDRVMEILRLNLCIARNLAECVELSSLNRPQVLQKNLAQHKTLLEMLRKGGVTTLRTPATLQTIVSILEFNPNLFSLSLMQTIGQKRLPGQLSISGSLSLLRRLGTPMLQAGSKPFPIQTPWRNKLSATPWATARIQIDRIRPILANEARAYADALSDLGKTYDNKVLNPPQSPPAKAELEKRISQMRKKLNEAYQPLKPPPPPEAKEAPPPPAPEELVDTLQEF